MNFKPITEWSPQELAARQSNCVLVDVRRPEEFTGPLSHVKGAKLVTLESDLMLFLRSSIENLKDQQLVFICRSGVRSYQAAEIAAAMGYRDPINLKGGMIAWNEAKLPTDASEK